MFLVKNIYARGYYTRFSMVNSKSQLAIILSKLKVFEKPSQYREQYTTDSEAGASVLWFAFMRGDVKDKTVADLGSGTGLLGIGACLLGAKKVFLVEIDKAAVDIINDNIKIVNESAKDKKMTDKITVINGDINNFNEKLQTVVQNPPFGVIKQHADKEFLEKAFQISDVIYSFHKIDSDKFINDISSKNNFRITNLLEFDFPIKQTMKHHTKRIHRFKVGCWRMERIKKIV